MPITAFEGPAGTGKTYNLIAELCVRLRNRALASHERVLALTFMHGARRRLDQQLRQIRELDCRFQAVTLDSFAWKLVQRWRRLASSLGYALPAEENYDDTCALAAKLMARPTIKSWIRLSYPILVVDEAQDLSFERSAMISAATDSCYVLLAFDEFQCLDPGLRPMAIHSWLTNLCTPTSLTQCRRTDVNELLEAAHAIRNGQAIRHDGSRFKVAITPSTVLAATYLANAISWRGGGTLAVLTPSRAGGFVNEVISMVQRQPLGRQRSGPYPIQWEGSDESDHREICGALRIPERCTVAEAIAHLDQHMNTPVVKALKEWVIRQRRVLGLEEISVDQIHRFLKRSFTARRRHAGNRQSQLLAMTIQQAKNREFDHVVVIWPYTVPNDNEQKRRLLYNALTRAQQSCLVLVQAQRLLNQPPFSS